MRLQVIVFAFLGCALLQHVASVQHPSPQLKIARTGAKGSKSDAKQDARLDADDDVRAKSRKIGLRETEEAIAQNSVLNGASGSAGPTEGANALLCMSPSKRKAASSSPLKHGISFSPRLSGKQSVGPVLSKKNLGVSAPTTPRRPNGTASSTAAAAASPKSPRVWSVKPPKPPTRGPASPLHSVFQATTQTKNTSRGTYQLTLCQVTPCNCPHVWQSTKHRDSKARRNHLEAEHKVMWKDFQEFSTEDMVHFVQSGQAPVRFQTKTAVEPEAEEQLPQQNGSAPEPLPPQSEAAKAICRSYARNICAMRCEPVHAFTPADDAFFEDVAKHCKAKYVYKGSPPTSVRRVLKVAIRISWLEPNI